MFSQAELITPSWAMPGGKFAKPHDVNNLQRSLIFFQGNSRLVIPAKRLFCPSAIWTNACLLPALAQDCAAQPEHGGKHWSFLCGLGLDMEMLGPDVQVPPLAPGGVNWLQSPSPHLYPTGKHSVLSKGLHCCFLALFHIGDVSVLFWFLVHPHIGSSSILRGFEN